MQFLLKKKMSQNIFPGVLKANHVYLALPISCKFKKSSSQNNVLTNALVYTAIPSKIEMGAKTYNIFGKGSTIEEVLDTLKQIIQANEVNGNTNLTKIPLPLLMNLRDYTLDKQGLVELNPIDPIDQQSRASSSRAFDDDLVTDPGGQEYEDGYGNKFEDMGPENFWAVSGGGGGSGSGSYEQVESFTATFLEQHPTSPIYQSQFVIGLDANGNLQFRCCPIFKVEKSTGDIAYITQWTVNYYPDMSKPHIGDLNMANAFGASFNPEAIIVPGGLRVEDKSTGSGILYKRKYQLNYTYPTSQLMFEIDNTIS